MQILNRSLLASSLVMLFLSACRDSDPPATVPPPLHATSGPPPTTATMVATPSLRRVRGNAVMGKDGYGITLCGEDTQRIIEMSVQAKSTLDRFLEGGAREFFIDGWAAASAGTGVGLQRIERVYTEGPGCGEAPNDGILVARGNEPFWSLSINAAGLTLERPDHPALLIPGVSLQDVAGARRLDTPTAEGALQLEVTPGECSDGMSDTLYASTARLSLGSVSLAGCAFAGAGARPD